MENALHINEVKIKELQLYRYSIWKRVQQIWPLMPWSCCFMCQFFQSFGIVVIWKCPVWRVPHLFGFLSIQFITGWPASVWSDHNHWKWRGRIILTNVNCAFLVETQQRCDLAEGVSPGFDSRKWHCRKPLLKSTLMPWAAVAADMYIFLWAVKFVLILFFE